MKIVIIALAAATALCLAGCTTVAGQLHEDPATLKVQVQEGIGVAEQTLQVVHLVVDQSIADGAIKANDAPKARQALNDADVALAAAKAAYVIGDDTTTAQKTAAAISAALEIERLFVPSAPPAPKP